MERRAGSVWYGVVTQLWSPSHTLWVSELRAGWVRLDFNWFETEPARGAFDWTLLDSRVAAASAQGLRIYATLAYTPMWAGPCQHCMPDDVADWRRFVAAVLTHFRGYGIVYGIWNEPNLRFLNDAPDGSQYAALFREANGARSEADRDAILAGPETSHHAIDAYYPQVMAQILPLMRGSDVVTVHYYPDAPVDIHAYMTAVGQSAAGHHVWLTETGVSTCDDTVQRDYFASVLDAFYQSGRGEWNRVFFYVLQNGHDCTENMIRTDGSYRPSFTTYRDFILAHP